MMNPIENRKGRVWVISEFYYPVVISTGYYMTEIAEYLAAKGLEVHAICTDARYNEDKAYATEKKSCHNNVCIHRVWTGTIDKNNLLKRTFRLLWSSIRLFFKIMTCVKKGDRMLVVTNPAFILLAMPIIKVLKQADYILLVHDIFPENVLATGKIKSSSLFYRFLKLIFDWAYSKPDICISIGRDMTEVVKAKIKSDKPIELITNWADVDEVYPQKKEATKLCQQLKLENKFVFQFAGNLGQVQGLDTILEAIRLTDNPAMCFLFIGGGAKESVLREFIRNNPLKHTILLGFQDRSLQNDFLNACDVSFVTLSQGMYGLGVPSKSYNIMAAGKPMLVVADERSEIARCVKEFRLGWVVAPNQPQQLKKTFEKIYETVGLEDMKQRARRVAEMHFAKNIILEKYYQLLK